MKTRIITLIAVLTVGLLGVLAAGAAFADDRERPRGQANRHDARTRRDDRPGPRGPAAGRDHDGDADEDAATVVTEDTDGNDGDTPDDVADAGDNAHPSGNDRSVENGSNGNQGRAESAPDEDGRGPERDAGGTDKPDGPGGVDLADQDGNNGCGNDDDFEDDNEGWCGKPIAPEATEEPTVQPSEQQTDAPLEPETPRVADDSDERDVADDDAAPATEATEPTPEATKAPETVAVADTAVLGEVYERVPAVRLAPAETVRPAVFAGDALPRTGVPVTAAAWAGLVLVGSGAVMLKR